jgi:hypothetical protein
MYKHVRTNDTARLIFNRCTNRDDKWESTADDYIVFNKIDGCTITKTITAKILQIVQTNITDDSTDNKLNFVQLVIFFNLQLYNYKNSTDCVQVSAHI